MFGNLKERAVLRLGPRFHKPMVVGSNPAIATKINIDVMEWHLFLDDERLPATTDDRVYVARDFDSAVNLIFAHDNCPTFISFDHDLGHDSLTGFDFAKWLVEKDMDDGGEFIPKNFYFYVHSQNPVGKENIEKYLQGYLKYR